MNEKNVFKNHISLTYANEVKQICRPLFELLGIQHFSFTLYYKDGGIIRLSTCPEWTVYYFNHHYFEVIPSLNNNDDKMSMSIWDYLSESENSNFLKVAKKAKEFNIAHGFTIIKNLKDFKMACSLATINGSTKVNNLYINNINCIEKFIYYFYNKSYPMIEKIKQNKIYSRKPNSDSLRSEKLKKQSNLDLNKFYQIIEIDKVFLENICLSKQETICLLNAMQGKTSKQIARILTISHRTVDTHLENIKNKVGAINRISLIEMAYNSEILKDILLRGDLFSSYKKYLSDKEY